MSFQSGVTSTDDNEVEVLFGTKTPGADNLLGGSKTEGQSEATEEVIVDEKKKAPAKKVQATAVEGEIQPEVINHEEDAELLLGKTEGEETTEVADDQKTIAPKKVEPKKAATSKVPEDQEINFEAIYNDMVAEGIWKEVELPEGAKWNKEMFLQAQKLQTTSQYEDLLSRTGDYGKAIIKFEQDGGNPKELLDLFRDQKEVQEFDIKDADSQETFLRAYLEAQGNSQKSIDRTVRALQDQGPEALKEEAEEKKAIWDDQYKQEIEARKTEQALYAKQVEDAQKSFQSTISTALTADAEVTPKERKELQSYILNYTQNFNGRDVSQFYVDMAEIQKDPKNYIELAKFIKGLKTGEYTKKVIDKVKKEVSATSYLKIKNNATIKGVGSGTPEVETSRGTNFVSLLTKRS